MSLVRPLLIVALATAAMACDSSKASSTKSGTSAAPAQAATAAAPAQAAPGQSFGAGVKLTESTPIATLLADPKAHVGKTVRVEGQVVDVCPKRGCWMDLAGDAPGQKLRFKVVDGEMVFPVDAKGKHAVVEGVVAVNELSLEETKEYVAYQQKEYGAEKDPASVTEPMVIVRVDGTGAQLRDRK
ncbi:MAG: DUF4920 domain-containing protein [Deltaproteobacteria bacterium]|nr:DUF4920 domain-containing protein [Kofleriaceae bacterium]